MRRDIRHMAHCDSSMAIGDSTVGTIYPAGIVTASFPLTTVVV